MKKILLVVVLSFIFIGCNNEKIYLVGEIQDNYKEKIYDTKYKETINYPKKTNNYSSEL